MTKHVPFTGAEKESLRVALDRHRDAVLWKLEGLDDEQLRRPVTPSGTNLLGLVKHLAVGELGWFCATFGRDAESLPLDPTAEGFCDMRVEPHESTEDVLRFYDRARAAADKVVDELGIEDRRARGSGSPHGASKYGASADPLGHRSRPSSFVEAFVAAQEPGRAGKAGKEQFIGAGAEPPPEAVTVTPVPEGDRSVRLSAMSAYRAVTAVAATTGAQPSDPVR